MLLRALIRESISSHLSKKRLDILEADGRLKERRNRLKGGLGDKAKASDFDKAQVEKGIEVELEHTNNREEALEIVLDHLTEDPKYYTKLAKIEDH
jgi:hypothetical protein